MLEKLKMYALEVILNKYIPIGALTAFAFVGTYMAAHSGMFESYGITYGVWPFTWTPEQVPSGPCILIELDTLSAKTITALISLAAIVIRATQHHVTSVPPKEN